MNIIKKKLYVENSEVSFESVFSSLQELFFRLNEKDYLFGIRKLLTSNAQLNNTLTYVQMREWKKAFQNFNEILDKNLLNKGLFIEK